MPLNAPLNEKQLEVLLWVDEGAPAERYEDFSHRVIARALHNRRLVEVTGRGQNWQATITSKGQYYLEHGEYPPSQATPDVIPAKPGASPELAQTPPPDPQREKAISSENTVLQKKQQEPKAKPIGVAA